MESNPDYLFHMPKGQEFLNWRGNLKPVFHDMPNIATYCLWKISIETVLEGYIEVKTASNLDAEWIKIRVC